MSEMRLYSIRGATCAQNTEESIKNSVGELCTNLFKNNHLSAENIVNIQFTITPDLTKLNPATALRKSDVGLDTSQIPLFCSQEAVIDGMLPCVIRIMITTYLPCESKIIPAYLNGAEALRPDIAKGEH